MKINYLNLVVLILSCILLCIIAYRFDRTSISVMLIMLWIILARKIEIIND